jgi:hypothetical protein
VGGEDVDQGYDGVMEGRDRGGRLRDIEVGGMFGFLPGVSGRDGLLYM